MKAELPRLQPTRVGRSDRGWPSADGRERSSPARWRMTPSRRCRSSPRAPHRAAKLGGCGVLAGRRVIGTGCRDRSTRSCPLADRSWRRRCTVPQRRARRSGAFDGVAHEPVRCGVVLDRPEVGIALRRGRPVVAVTQSWFGREAVNFRRTRSSGGPGLVRAPSQLAVLRLPTSQERVRDLGYCGAGRTQETVRMSAGRTHDASTPAGASR
jgi:hypothetical protein